MAQRITITLRVTLCYLAGVTESLLAFASPHRDPAMHDLLTTFVLALVVGLLASWPLWLAAAAVAFVFGRSVAVNPGVWSVAASLIAAGFSYGVLPSDEVRSLATVGALAAALAGISFYCWSVWSPVRPVSN
ncbi:MAG: hypothetical protein E5W98_20635 [Mesorhizobium sp.]|nr:MAG: hypothetical protein E5W98_20635 [Mesorhizobium sp.]